MLPVLSFPNIVQVAELEILDLVKGMTYLFHKQSLKKIVFKSQQSFISVGHKNFCGGCKDFITGDLDCLVICGVSLFS